MGQIVTKYYRMGFFLQTIRHGEMDKLGLASELERFADDQWVGANCSEDDAVATVMDRFRKIELRASAEQPEA